MEKSIFLLYLIGDNLRFLRGWEERLHFSAETEKRNDVLVNLLHKNSLNSQRLTEWGSKNSFY